MLLLNSGCKTCKIRRIKCDGASPVCNNCRKSKKARTCTGTVAPHSIIHVENKYANGNKKRPRGPRSPSQADAVSSLRPQYLSGTDIRTQAIAYFVHEHLPAPNDGPGILRGLYSDFLPRWIKRMECPLLNQALTAVALVAFAHAQSQQRAISIAAMEYQKLLRNMRDKLSLLNADLVDVSLIANFFMGRFEDMMYKQGQGDSRLLLSRRFPHSDGALAIMKVWKDNLSQCHPASSVVKHTRRGLIRSALLRDQKLPEWLLDGSRFGEEGSDLEYYRIFSMLTNIRHDILTYPEQPAVADLSSEKGTIRLVQLMRELENLDAALQCWVTKFPTTWSYREHELHEKHPWRMTGSRLSKLNMFADVTYASAWNHYFATRMLLQDTRRRALQLAQVNDDLNDNYNECKACLECMADNLAASLPYALQEVQTLPLSEGTISFTRKDPTPKIASLAIWPLSIAVGLVELSPELESQFRSVLGNLGRIVGSPVLRAYSQREEPRKD